MYFILYMYIIYSIICKYVYMSNESKVNKYILQIIFI